MIGFCHNQGEEASLADAVNVADGPGDKHVLPW